jgi:excisionase family DNA binding protein
VSKDTNTTKYLLSVEGAAILLGIDRSTAYRSITDGTFPVKVLTIGRRKKVSRAALMRVLNGKTVAVAS